MFVRIGKKNELARLRHTYTKLMKQAYKIAIKDRDKSNEIHEKACEILQRIKEIETNIEIPKK